MIDKCPHCGFEPLDGKLVCPRCGHEIKENIAQKLHEIDEKNRKSNDSVSWSDFEDVSLGALMSQMNEEEPALPQQEAEETDSDSSQVEEEEEFSENPILAAYIKRHRLGIDEEGPTLEELIAASRTEGSSESDGEVDSAEKAADSAEEPIVSDAQEVIESAEKSESAPEPVEFEASEAKNERPTETEPALNADDTLTTASEAARESEAIPDLDSEHPQIPGIPSVTEKTAIEDSEDVSETLEVPTEENSAVSAFLASEEPEKAVEKDDFEDSALSENEVDETQAKPAVFPAEAAADVTEENELNQDAELTDEVKLLAEPMQQETAPAKDQRDAAQSAVSKPPVPNKTITSPEEQLPDYENMTDGDAKKRKKWPFLLAAAVVLAAGGGGYAYHEYQEQQKAEAQTQAAKKAAAESEALQQALAGMYLDDDREFLKAGITQAELASLSSRLVKTSVDKSALEQELADINDKFQLQSAVNRLFQKPVINGSELEKDVPIEPDSQADFQLPAEKTPFNQLLSEALADFQQQKEALAAAEQAFTPLIKDGKVAADPQEADYQKAQKLTAALVASPEKEQLQARLKTVQEKISANKAAAVKAAEEAAAAAAKEAEANAAAESNGTTGETTAPNPSGNGNGTDNQGSSLPAEASPNMQPNAENAPILGKVEADIADSSNPAWTWAPGIKEQVLATCKERGYIVDGGYMLEPVRIEDGEGYYNLYATNNQAPLTKGMTSDELPLYLVTINCKTGYFRGNGNDHTIR